MKKKPKQSIVQNMPVFPGRRDSLDKKIYSLNKNISLADVTVATAESGGAPLGDSKHIHSEKRVRFLKNETTGELANQVFVYQRCGFKDKRDVWYTRAEFSYSLDTVQKYSASVNKECPTIPTLLNHLRRRAVALEGGLPESDRSMLRVWSNSKARGLEEYLGAATQQKRKQGTSRVLKFQSRLKGMLSDDRARALAERASMESQKSCSFAKLLGVGDEMVAREIHRQSSVKKLMTRSRKDRRRSSTGRVEVCV